MKIIKVDIQTESIERMIPTQTLREPVLSDSEFGSIIEREYEIRRIIDINKKEKLYYVPIDKRQVFNDLVQINFDDIEKQYVCGYKKGKRDVIDLVIKKLKSKWYMRIILKRFINVLQNLYFQSYN